MRCACDVGVFFRCSRSVTVQSQLLQFFCFMLALFPILTFFSKETQFKGREFPDWTSTHDEWKILEKDADSNYLIGITQHKDWCTLFRTKCSSVSLLCLVRIKVHQPLGNLCINQNTIRIKFKTKQYDSYFLHWT